MFDDDDYWIGLQNAAHFLKCSKVTKNKNISLFPNVKFIYQITYFGILLNQLNAPDKIESSSKLQKVGVEKKLSICHTNFHVEKKIRNRNSIFQIKNLLLQKKWWFQKVCNFYHVNQFNPI